jgi:type IV secretion system protein TrbL
MLRSLWRWRIFVYAFIGVLVGFFMISVGHPASAQIINTNNLSNSWQIGAQNANLPNADLLSPMVSSLNSIQGQIQTYAQRLFLLLVTLDVFWMVAQFMMTRDNLGEFLTQVFTKVFTVVFVYYVLIQNGPQLVTTVIGSFAYIPQNANISGQYNTGATPTALLAEGALLAAVPVAEAVGLDLIPDEGLGTGATNLSKAASEMLTGAAFAIFGAFSGLAAEIAIATLEVYVVLNLGIIVTGFLGSRWTEKYGQGFFAYAISAGVKYMFVQIILGLMYPYLLETAATEAIPVVGPAIYAAIALMIVAIVHAVPSFAGSALSGQSNSSGAQLAGAMSQVFGGVAGGAKALGGLPAQNAASRSAKADQQFKSDQMRDYYSSKEASSAKESNRAMMQMEARPTASLENTKPGAGAAGPTGANGVATGNAASAVTGTTGETATKFSPAAISPTNGQALSGGGSNGAESAFRPVLPPTTAATASNVGGFGGGAEANPLQAAPTGQPAQTGVQGTFEAPQATPTLFSEGVGAAALTAPAATVNPVTALGKALQTPPTKLGALSATEKAAASAVTAKPLTAAPGNAANPLASAQLQKGLEGAKNDAGKIPETAIGISAESLHASVRNDMAALPPQSAPPPLQAPKQAIPAAAAALSSGRPSVTALAQQRSKPLPEIPQAKPLQGEPPK